MTEYDFVIKTDDLSSPQTGALITLHLQGMAQNTPQENMFMPWIKAACGRITSVSGVNGPVTVSQRSGR